VDERWMARVDARLEHIDRELTELRRSDLEQRVSTLERVVDEELRPLLSTFGRRALGGQDNRRKHGLAADRAANIQHPAGVRS